MIDLDEPRFSLGQVAKALGISASTLRSWLRLKYFGLGQGDSERQAEGHAHAISLRTALWAGAVVEVTKHGVPAGRAAKIAAAFALHADVDQKTEQTVRGAGELYPGHGVYTLLVAYPGDDVGHVIRIDDKTPLQPIFFDQRTGRATSALIVWLNFVEKAIHMNLLQRGEGI